MATPLTADALLAALRAEGVHVVEVGDWRTHNRNSKGAWGPVNGVIVHHTATGPGVDIVSMIYNGRSDLPGPLATGCITKDGTVHLTANGRANHAGGGDPAVLAAVVDESYGDYPPAPHEHQGSAGAVDGNSRFYGWECENKGDGTDPWPRAQYVAMVKATAAICRAHRWGPKSAIGHKEWSDWKPDPRGIDMKDFRRDLAACLALPAGQWGTQHEEDSMPTPQEIAKAILDEYKVDDPRAAGTNYIPLKQLLWFLGADAGHTRNAADRVEGEVKALAAKVDALAVGGVDLDALAVKVADLLAARLAN